MQVSIVNFSGIQNSNFGERLDAEFYLPVYLTFDTNINKDSYCNLSDITSKIDVGYVGSMVNEYSKKGIWLIQTKNVKSFFLNYSNQIYINLAFHKELKKSQVENEDILIARSGSFGTASIYLSNDIVNSSDIIIIKAHRAIISPYYLVTFLNCRYGSIQLIRFSSGGLQGHVNLTILEKLRVPRFSVSFEIEIESIVLRSYHLIEKANAKYQQAQDLLLTELGLTDWQPTHQLTFIKHYSDTIQAGRCDAEYFQPKYEAIVEAIQGYPGGWDTLENLVELKDQNFNPKDKKQYKYIELANITENGEIANCMTEIGQDLPTRARRKLATGDVIVSSIEGSLSSIALIENEYDQAFCSTGFHVICAKDLNSETLLVMLKSIVGQLQLKKGCSGTILTAINKKEYSKIILPKVVEVTQAQIQQKLTESLTLRAQSKQLLDCAKRAMEIAIEQDEQRAITWLENESTANITRNSKGQDTAAKVDP